ncbi:thiamine pyrophosphate-dependent enzyme, possible carboligase or decarboxylase [Rivularia sp. PCC 7116]|uniref:thiamine pyrophosphate-dependent enzyme n=1 Tax=Rivularia sp. PCC 7116 TaxID=373994 RepID=UPI00029F084E|nr:thiamine pyrophosphate-dependent enzyme [Rivularia sp. PCC 7116]AFY57216.1 thiamine pyrophosphate-dependent enzyme, possible carboligase or decarboxylase [Rivularia sp. PCC 7116]
MTGIFNSSTYSEGLDNASSDETTNNLPRMSVSVAETVVKMLEKLGIKHAFGVSGGAIARLWHSLQQSSIEVIHCRHESGAAFAATEAYFGNDCPTVVFTTTGPGITNALTGLMAARWEGAKVILLSGMTSTAQRGRWAVQETAANTMPYADIFTTGTIFDYATTLENSNQLPEISRRLALGLTQPGSFVAHISIPSAIQSSLSKTPLSQTFLSQSLATASEETVAECAKLLSEAPFAIWVGFGARKAAAAIRQLAEKTGAAVMCSPRGKGIFPENHPQFAGVTGFAGHESVLQYMQEYRPLRTLVLGSRLGELTSFWNPALVPDRGFIHVDIDPTVPGTAYPEAETVGIQSDVGVFVRALLKYFPEHPKQLSNIELPAPERKAIAAKTEGLIRPQFLMQAIQQQIVENSNAVVMAEAGNSLAWANNLLYFLQPERYRVSPGFGSMGHFSTGVVGTSLVCSQKAVAIIGDGSMLMNNEVSTAVRYQIPAVWIVLNDGLYNMCDQGQAMQGFKQTDAMIPQTDFAQFARSMGAEFIRVERESDIYVAFEKAMKSEKPFVIDVLIEPTQISPIGNRIESLNSQWT